MKFFSTVLFMVCVINYSNAQTIITEKDLLGKWQPKSASVNSMYHDFDKDSTYLPPEVKLTFKNKEDSVMTVSMVAFLFEMIKGTTFSFEANNVYAEINAAGKIKAGTYKLQKDSSLLTTFIRNKTQAYIIALKDGILSLQATEDDKTIVMYLRKL
jgi:hypothetical protein